MKLDIITVPPKPTPPPEKEYVVTFTEEEYKTLVTIGVRLIPTDTTADYHHGIADFCAAVNGLPGSYKMMTVSERAERVRGYVLLSSD